MEVYITGSVMSAVPRGRFLTTSSFKLTYMSEESPLSSWSSCDVSRLTGGRGFGSQGQFLQQITQAEHHWSVTVD